LNNWWRQRWTTCRYFFHEKMSNVEVIVEAWPTRDDLRIAGVCG
jgi:hypothetical protein